MKYDLFVADFDGTLGTAPDIIAPETVSAIKRYVEKGGIFAVCSGRMMSSILPICRKYGFKGLVVAYQGAMISDIETGENLFSGGIDVPVALKITTELVDLGLPVIADMDDIMYFQGSSEFIDLYEKVSKVKGVKVADIIGEISEQNKKVQKILGLCGPERTKALTARLQKEYEGSLLINNGAPVLVEAVSPTCSKRVAVEFLAKYYGVPQGKVIAVGDSTNDIELLSGAWHGVAVGDGCEELKNVADEITVPFKKQPVKVLLEKYCI